MHNLLIDIVTKNIPNDFIGFINRSLYEKIRKEFKKLQLLYSNIDLDTIKDHFFIYVTSIENTKYTLEDYETIIINAIDSINFKYKYNHESLSFKESILQIKIFNEEQHKTINFNDVDENKNNELVNSSTFNDFSSALLKNEIILKKDQRLESF
ncbi:MAG: glycine--tRNA ligase subunit beta, partial [Finegoldia magna]|nr:glycine--tRNA ligase subunit beta [Finegoldia magna]